jgi:NTE family protein
MTTALILSGGGARAAYQVGVLKALAEILPEHSHNPFEIICGTSAGAINTLTLVGRRGSFRQRTLEIEKLWRGLRAENIYRTDFASVALNTAKLVFSLAFTGLGIRQPLALLDSSPLRALLQQAVCFRDVDEAIASGYLKAVAITAMSYNTGQSITFFQGTHDNWQRARRLGVRTGLTLDHLLASAAIPTLFAPVKIGNRYYGDGALRQLKPLSPALHLGAQRLFVVGVSDNANNRPAAELNYSSPTVGQMIGHMLNSAFIDTLESDLETLEALNAIARQVTAVPCETPGLDYVRHVEHCVITPSRAINRIAENYLHELPASVRLFLRLSGTNTGQSGSSAASYLLFEPGFCGELIDMGHADTWAKEQVVRAFFNIQGNGQ